MPILRAGAQAPEIALKDPAGKPWSLSAEAKARPTVVAFYKSSCPICQMTFPFLEKIAKAHAGPAAAVVGVSQDSPAETAEWMRARALTFPHVVDEGGWKASRAYGLQTVPSVFLVGTGGAIEQSFEGFSKAGLDAAAAALAKRTGKKPIALFRDGDGLPAFKPG